jgi:hypothetical protein
VLDAGGFLEDLAHPGSVADLQLSALFDRLAGFGHADASAKGA